MLGYRAPAVPGSADWRSTSMTGHRGALVSVLLLALGAGCGREERARRLFDGHPGGLPAGDRPGAEPFRDPVRARPRRPGCRGGRLQHWPPEVTKLPQLGGLFNRTWRRSSRFKPDLAVLVPSEGDLAQKLKGLGVDSITLSNETLGDASSGRSTCSPTAVVFQKRGTGWRRSGVRG